MKSGAVPARTGRAADMNKSTLLLVLGVLAVLAVSTTVFTVND